MKIAQTKRGALLCAQAELSGIAASITRFDRQCNQAQHTDTGCLWELLYAIKKDARKALREIRRAK